ncbi:MAG: hypothetical protein NTZ46_02650, partial [Verrucomicrobia bacterium]|nr:hypothetical protein [Verrucomicrobiota bacterium]
QFRSYYDGNAGFTPSLVGTTFFPPDAGNVLGLDRGRIFAELGLRMPDLPEVTLRYERDYRYGQKDSTEWGTATVGALSRKIAPSFRNIKETLDIFSLDLAHTLGNTDLHLGVRFEHQSNDDSLNVSMNPQEPTKERKLTQVDTLSGDMFTAHGDTETRFSDKLWFTTGYAYTTFNTNIGGSRAFGLDYDADAASPIIPTSQYRDHGFFDLVGGSQLDQNVACMNLMWMPTPHLSLIAAVRFEKEENDNVARFMDTGINSNKTTVTLTPYLDNSSNDTKRIAESFEARYTGLADWVFYTRGEWTEESGAVIEHVKNLTTQAVTGYDYDRDRLVQKYIVGANWYACSMASLSAQYYFKSAENDYTFPTRVNHVTLVSGPIEAQNLYTHDVNTRITLRPLSNLVFVTRYDLQRQEIDTAEDSGETLESGQIINNIFSECVTWSPLDRLYLQGNVSYVLSKTDIPVTLPGPVNLGISNNYLTVGAGAGYALDDKTDIRADYTYYKADNYKDTSRLAQPYGVGASEHTATLGVTRQIRRNVTVNVKGGYFQYVDQTSGYHNNFSGTLLFTSMQVRF